MIITVLKVPRCEKELRKKKFHTFKTPSFGCCWASKIFVILDFEVRALNFGGSSSCWRLLSKVLLACETHCVWSSEIFFSPERESC